MSTTPAPHPPAPATTDALPDQRRPADALREAAVSAFADTWASFAGHLDRSSVVTTDGVMRLRMGVPAAPFNGVWGLGAAVSSSAVLTAVEEFRAGDLPWNVQLRPGYPVELDEALAERGLVVVGEIPFMVLGGDAALTEALGTTTASLRRAATLADLESAIDLMERGFGMPPELTRRGLPVTALVSDGATTWIASDGGEDVSTACVVVGPHGCGIYNVATPEAHRRKGYGAAATAHAALSGLAAGAALVYLQSSPMGYPVYERLGFVTVERWRQWFPQQYVG